MRKFLLWLKSLNRKQVAADAGIFIGLFFVFLYLTFPYDIIRDTVVQRIESQGKVTASIGSIEPFRLFGVRIKDLKVADAEEPAKVLLNIDETRVRIRPTELLLGRLWIDFDVDAAGGGVAGSYCRRKTANDLAMNFVDFRLAKYGFRDLARKFGQIDVDGVIGGDFNMHFASGSHKSTSGALNLNLNKLRIANLNFNNKTFPNINFEPGRLSMEMQQQIFKLSDFTLKGDNLSLKASGQVTINQDNPKKSRVNVSFKFKPSEEFEQSLGIIAMGLGEADPDGYYGYTLNGPFDNLTPHK